MKTLVLALTYLMSTCIFLSNVEAAPLAMGGSVGGDFPLAHDDSYGAGVSAEGFYRVDPYEIRFHYSATKVETYSLVLGRKYFFSQGIVRPFVEGAAGPVIVHTNHKGLAFGAKPDFTLGTDVAINSHFSTGASMRYFALIYFGSTNSGKFEANHGFSLMGHLTLWF